MHFMVYYGNLKDRNDYGEIAYFKQMSRIQNFRNKL